MTTLSYKTMAFGPEILGICQHLNLYAPIFLLEPVETRGADDYWEAKVSLFGSARKPEREITETFEVHVEAKEQCLRIAADGGEVNRFSWVAFLVNRANKRFLITHKSRGSIVAFR